MTRIAIITARGGSKRIPRKNLRPFLGRPIIAYSIEAALASGLFDTVMVSTDDEEIAALSRKLGADVPFYRSKETSDDYATTTDVLVEVVTTYGKLGIDIDIGCCIFPTAPFVTPGKLQAAFAMMERTGADTVLPIARFSFPIWRSFRKEGDRVFFNWPETAMVRSQDLPTAWQDAGQFYFFRSSTLLGERRLVTEHTVGFEVSEMEVQDIDTEDDWALGELKYRNLFPA